MHMSVFHFILQNINALQSMDGGMCGKSNFNTIKREQIRGRSSLKKEYKYHPTYSGKFALSLGLVCSTSLFLGNDRHILVCLMQCCLPQLVVMLWLRETHTRTACEFSAAACCFSSLRPVGEPSGFCSPIAHLFCSPIAEQVYFPNILIHFLYPYLHWMVSQRRG